MLDGFGIAGYRSFGPAPQYLCPLQKVNLVVGRNNVGKSNVLRLVQLLEQFVRRPQSFQPPAGLDAHIGSQDASFSWRFPLKVDDEAIAWILEQLFPKAPAEHRKWSFLVKAILTGLPSYDGERVWVTVRNSNGWKPDLPKSQEIADALQKKFKTLDVRSGWSGLWTAITRHTGGSFEQHHGPIVLEKLMGLAIPFVPPVSLLSAHRQIGAPGTTYEGLNGQGLIARLLQLQNPELATRDENLEKFRRINRFVAQVLEVEDARLEIPHSGKELNVSIGERVLPIESLGTGVHEVIIFAVAATAVENEILCIEEPEIHLHPRLQRQLLNYLQGQTTNQYFITTHSACLLDTPCAALFHITLNECDETEVVRLDLPGHRAAAGFDLGYRASDLVQSNSIVWVEGPSDRIYINAWIKHVEPNLLEGVHYSIMFYGGRLLSHLAANDESVSDFIALQRLNRHVAIVIDSDKRKPDDAMNSTKSRVLNEVEKSGGFGWVTAGREVENYVPTPAMRATLLKVHPNTTFRTPKTEWNCCYEAEGNRNFSIDKVAVARAAVESIDLDRLDLRLRLQGLVDFIRSANR